MENCRVCLRESTSHESFTSDTREKFFQVTSVYIDESEDDFICRDCLDRLSVAYEFRLEAINADSWFRKRLATKEFTVQQPENVEKRQNPPKNKRKCIESPTSFFVCDKCGTKFSTKREIKRHMRQKHIQKQLKCPEINCGKEFSVFKVYQNHVNKHLAPENQTKWICEYCAKCFNSKYKLTLHSRSHTNVRPYKCTQCPASFKQQTDLNTHVKSLHSDDRPFECKDCGMSFKIPNSLRSHRKRKHHQESMLECSECHKRVMCSSELKEHMAIYHRGERNHACKFCTKTYTKAYHLRRHMQDAHQELYAKLVASGELRTVNRSARIKVEVVETPPQTSIEHVIEANTFVVSYCE
ncbi:oocyte zinc finger protein XlCOF26-like [Culicoides brevitarsis]|uniref:oocyte zinc finger protein XlCOF26-like n=1 Tax=Culicoides brevitarsis TaxID=469753 RepID=UPI00307BED67